MGLIRNKTKQNETKQNWNKTKQDKTKFIEAKCLACHSDISSFNLTLPILGSVGRGRKLWMALVESRRDEIKQNEAPWMTLVVCLFLYELFVNARISMFPNFLWDQEKERCKWDK